MFRNEPSERFCARAVFFMADTSQTTDTTRQEAVTYMDDLNYHRMADMFDLSYEDRKDDSIAEKFSFLADWAKEHSKSEDRLDQYLAIKDLTRSLGYQSTGKDLIKKLYQWTRLDQDRRQVEKKMELIT